MKRTMRQSSTLKESSKVYGVKYCHIDIGVCVCQVYQGEDTSYRLEGLHNRTEYQVRVCGIRISTSPPPSSGEEEGTESDGVATPMPRSPPSLATGVESELMGAFSPGVSFTTHSPKPVNPIDPTSVIQSKMAEKKPQLTDQHWAFIFLLCFALCAVIFAFLAQQIITYTSGSSEPEHAQTNNSLQ